MSCDRTCGSTTSWRICGAMRRECARKKPRLQTGPQKRWVSRLERAVLGGLFRAATLGGQFGQRFHHIIKDSAEIFQSRCRNDNSVPPSIHIFSDAQEPAAWVFFERED